MVPPAAVSLEGMRGRAEAKVRSVVPVFVVVPRNKGAMPRKVGHLVMSVASHLEKIRCHGEKPQPFLFSGEADPVVCDPSMKRGPFLESQLVARQVLGLETKRRFQGCLPKLERLARNPVDEIDPEVVEAGLSCSFDRHFGPTAVVTAAQESQYTIIEGLHPDAHPVDAHIMEFLSSEFHPRLRD